MKNQLEFFRLYSWRVLTPAHRFFDSRKNLRWNVALMFSNRFWKRSGPQFNECDIRNKPQMCFISVWPVTWERACNYWEESVTLRHAKIPGTTVLWEAVHIWLLSDIWQHNWAFHIHDGSRTLWRPPRRVPPFHRIQHVPVITKMSSPPTHSQRLSDYYQTNWFASLWAMSYELIHRISMQSRHWIIPTVATVSTTTTQICNRQNFRYFKQPSKGNIRFNAPQYQFLLK